MEEGFEVDEELLQATLDDLRYRRRLVSAEETERWLAERQLSEDELVDALAREHWRDRFQGEVSEIRGAYAPHPGAAVQALWPALIVHQRLAPLAVALARRVVAPILMADREGPAPSPEFRPLPGISQGQGGQAPSDPVPDWARCSAQWRERLLELEGCCQAVLREALSPRRLETALVSRRLDLTRFGLRMARFSSLDAAREARLCMTEDGESFDQAAGRGSVSREARALFLEQAPEPVAAFLVSAVPGESFLVEDDEGQPLLVQVAERSPAQLEDPEVRQRLESSLLTRSLDPVIEEHVRWLCPLE